MHVVNRRKRRVRVPTVLDVYYASLYLWLVSSGRFSDCAGTEGDKVMPTPPCVGAGLESLRHLRHCLPCGAPQI